MGVYPLDIGWAETADVRRYLYWELLACDEVRGVLSTARDDVLAVFFSGDRQRFHAWARSLAPERRTTPHGHQPTAPTTRKGALQ